jgi:hypothetical protein
VLINAGRGAAVRPAPPKKKMTQKITHWKKNSLWRIIIVRTSSEKERDKKTFSSVFVVFPFLRATNCHRHLVTIALSQVFFRIL